MELKGDAERTDSEGMASHTLLTLRYPVACSSCRVDLLRGTKAWWDPGARTATCVACGVENPVALSIVGRPTRRDIAVGSALEQDRRASNHWQRIDAAWQKGSDGERRLSTYLREGSDGRFILFDHRINPDSRADTDYIAVAPSGQTVYVGMNAGPLGSDGGFGEVVLLVVHLP